MRQTILPLFFIIFTSCDLFTKSEKSEPVIVEAPESKPLLSDTNDPSFLKIKIDGENYEISFFNQALPANNITELEAFLQKNKDRVNKDKVLVTGLGNSVNKQKILDLFARYGISKFHANSN